MREVTTMAQFDLFDNPIAVARGSYPFVVALQSNFAQDSSTQIVAPLALRAAVPTVSGRLTPIVEIGDSAYVVLMPSMTGVKARDLRVSRGSLAAARTALLAAIDYLFFGV